jgi:hypothetical protein
LPLGKPYSIILYSLVDRRIDRHVVFSMRNATVHESEGVDSACCGILMSGSFFSLLILCSAAHTTSTVEYIGSQDYKVLSDLEEYVLLPHGLLPIHAHSKKVYLRKF